MNITIRRVPFGYLVRIRAGVPPVFIQWGSKYNMRSGVISYIEKMWTCAQP